jgi:hypothetical protein
MGETAQREFLKGVSFTSTKKELFEQALEVHLYRTMAEFMGKEEGYCKGRGGGMHIADFKAGHLGANAIVVTGFSCPARPRNTGSSVKTSSTSGTVPRQRSSSTQSSRARRSWIAPHWPKIATMFEPPSKPATSIVAID